MTEQTFPTFDLGCGWAASFDARGGMWLRRPRGDMFIPPHELPTLRDVLMYWPPSHLGVHPVVAAGLRLLLSNRSTSRATA